MNDFMRTAIYALVAAGLTVAAVSTREREASTSEGFELQGEAFFPALQEMPDFTGVTSLEVWDFKPESAEAVPFKVEFKDGVWTIPSKDGYPADAGDKLGQVAAALANLSRGTYRTDREAEHESNGVVDPLADLSKPSEGRGRRITLRDAAGKELADLIVGKALEDEPGKRFVRLPSEKRVWSVPLELELSTKFSDWIETDLLKLDVAEITSITVDAYHVDEAERRVVEEYSLELGQSADGDWLLAGQADDEQAAMAAVDSMTETLSELTIADVQPFSYDVLGALGFFLVREGQQVFANEGELHVDTRNGVRYTIRFGEVVPSTDPEAGLQRFALIDAAPRFESLADPDNMESQAAATKAAKDLNKRFGGWFYVISSESFDALRPKRAALVEPKSEDEDVGGLDEGSFGENFFPPVEGGGTGSDDEHAGHDHGEEPEAPPAVTGTPPELLAEIEALANSGEVRDALSRAETEASAHPDDEQLLALIARLRDELAASEAPPAPEVPGEVLAEIDQLEADGKLSEALERAKAALEQHPGNAQLEGLVLQLQEQLGE